MERTLEQYSLTITNCKQLFINKMKDYGAAWRVLRLPSVTDQIYIKANRIRTLQEVKEQKVEDKVDGEFVGIINYSIIALIQLELGVVDKPDLDLKKAVELYDKKVNEAKQLMINKNHDYGEAWRDMRISSITDLIIQKLLRIKQIENNEGKLLVSEGLDANYYDIINYAVFVLILNEE